MNCHVRAVWPVVVALLVTACSGGAAAPTPTPVASIPVSPGTPTLGPTTGPVIAARPRFTYAAVPARTAPPVTAECPDGSRAPTLLALLANGSPEDTTTVVRLQQLALCAAGLRASAAGPVATWVRTAGGGTFATVERAADLSDQAVLYHRGNRSVLDPAGAGSTQRPEAYTDGTTAYKAATGQRFRLLLMRPGRKPVSLGETTTTMTAFGYSPSGRRLFVLAFDGLEPATLNSTLYVRDATGERTIRTGRPRGANLLVLDETRVVVGDIAETAADAAVVIDTTTGVQTPLRPGLFPTAFDAATGRLLVHSAPEGRLSWLSGPAFTVETLIPGLPEGSRVAGGDWLR